MISQISGVLDGSLNTTFRDENCCVILFCVLIYIFCLLFNPFFSRGASSNYFFVRRSSLLPHWCWSLWCWFSFKIKSSDLKKSSLTLLRHSNSGRNSIRAVSKFFRVKLVFGWRKMTDGRKVLRYLISRDDSFCHVTGLNHSTGWRIEIQGFVGTNHLFCSSKTARTAIFSNAKPPNAPDADCDRDSMKIWPKIHYDDLGTRPRTSLGYNEMPGKRHMRRSVNFALYYTGIYSKNGELTCWFHDQIISQYFSWSFSRTNSVIIFFIFSFFLKIKKRKNIFPKKIAI